MKGTALLLLCAATLARADQPQLTLSGKVCNCNPGEAANVCSQNGSDDQLVAHENCNQFYKCFDGSAIPYYCPANLLYSPLAEICDWPENVVCGDRPIVQPGTEEDCDEESNNSNESNGDQDNGGDSDEGSNGGTCNCNPGEAPAICAADGSDGVLVAHENCNQYYKCDNGRPVALNCPNGLLYNPHTEQCDWPANVDCGDRPIVEIDGGNNGGEEDCDLGGGNGESGSGGGNGDNGSGDNGNGDNGGSTCNCNPGEAPGICAADGSDGALVAHENCNQFYKCAHGVPVTQNCPAGLLYNPYHEYCDWPANVDCGDRPIVEIDGGDNGNGGGDNGAGSGEGDNGTGGGDGDNGSGGGTCNCNPGEAPGICAADGSDGALVAHENCNQFYKCAHGVPVTQNCPAGLLYNPYHEYCDWPANVDCGDRPIVEIDGGDNGNGGGDNESGGDNGAGSGEGDNGAGGGDSDNGSGGGTCNCNPGEAPGICAADGSDGALVAHENCNQFYKCAHGVPVTQNCPAGLLYNPHHEYCDWPANVDCGDRPIIEIEGGGNGDGGEGDNSSAGGDGDNGSNGNGNSNEENGGGTCNCNPGEAPGICAADGSGGTLIAHENCNQFYQCAHGVPVALFCPAGLLYNPYIERCDWPDHVNCGDRPIVEVEEGGNGGGDSGSGENGGTDNGGSDNGSSGGNGDTCDPSQAPAICAASGSDGVLVAHENCNQFYKCAEGVPVALDCPSNLNFNSVLQVCDWPENVECGDRVIPESGEDNNNGGGDSGTGDNGSGGNGSGDNGNGDNGSGDNGGTCNCNPDEAPAICAADGSGGTLIAHENCNQFYQCAHGVPVALFCPAGLLYNQYIQRCDWPDQVNCGDRPIVEVEEGGNGGGDSGSGDNGGTDNGGGDNGSSGGNGDTCDPSQAPAICAASGSDGVLVAHENCNQFYKCAEGVPVALDCPSNLHFNSVLQVCDWPENVECGDRVIPESGEDNNNGGGDSGTGDNGSGDNGSGNNGNGDNGSGDNGNGDNGSGDNGGTCNCNPDEAPAICAAEGSGGTLIAHENCNQFYQCAHGFPVALFCPAGLLYNQYIQRCDWPDQVNCGDRPIVEVEEGGNGGGDSGSGDNGGTDNGGGDNGSSGGNGDTCDPSQAPAICAASGSDGVLVAHENCNQFYKCSEGVPVALDCPSNLHFNSVLQVCDWPENVECGDRVIPESGEDNNNGGGDSGTGDNGSGDNGSGNNGNGDNGSGDNGNGDNGSGDNGGTCNCNPDEAPAICAAEGSGGTLIAHENCNQFYQCAHGFPVALFCPAGLLYNQYTQRCDWPDQVNCGDRPIVEVEEGGNGSGDSGSGDNGGTDNGGGDNGSSGGNGDTCDPSQAPAICAASGSDGVLVAHENCNQFYKCSEGVPVALDCPSNLHFNSVLQVCDWPENVECGDRVIPESGEDNNNGGGDSGTGDNGSGDNGSGNNGNGDNGSGDNGNGDNGSGDNGGTCNCNPDEAPAICAAEGSGGTLIAHENCNQFYQCAHGFPVALFCPAGLLYNQYTQRCDWPDQVNCGDRPIVEVEEGGNGGGDSGSGDNGGTDNGGGDNGSSGGNGDTCDPSQAPAICAASGSDGVLVAHENCNQFYKCSEGVPVALDCPSNLHFNSVLQVCDWPENVECGDRVIPESGEDNNNGGGDSGNGDNGSGDNGSGDNGGDNGSSGGNGDPSEAPAICSNSGSNGVLIAHENCDQFYVCLNGLPVTLDCPSNLLYNPETEQCDWPRNVECGDRIVPESEPEPESGGGSTPCACNSREAPAICAGSGSNGKLIAHENCNQYYMCFNGMPVSMSCPHSLFYEPHTEQCLWPASVSCDGRVITSYSSLNKHRDARRGFF